MADKIRFRCECGRKLGAAADIAGKKTRCPTCGKVVGIPMRSTEPPGPRGGEPDAGPAEPVRSPQTPAPVRVKKRKGRRTRVAVLAIFVVGAGLLANGPSRNWLLDHWRRARTPGSDGKKQRGPAPGRGRDPARGRGGAVTAPDGSTIGKQWLLAIGIDQYQDWRAWPKLDCAVSDAEAVREVLERRYCIDTVHKLYDKAATRQGIVDKLRFLARSVQADDSVLIYYAGHGHLDDLENMGFWVPVDGTREATTWIGSDRVKRYVAGMKAKHVLLISDSCFAGDFFRERSGIPEITEAYYRRVYAMPSRQAMTSGGVEPVADAACKGRSPFAYWLIYALEHNGKPYLVPNGLFGQLREGVAANSAQTPRVGYLHGAQHGGGEFVFFLKAQFVKATVGPPESGRRPGTGRLPRPAPKPVTVPERVTPPSRPAAPGSPHRHVRWTCATHKQVQKQEPGKCPTCSKALMRVRAQPLPRAFYGQLNRVIRCYLDMVKALAEDDPTAAHSAACALTKQYSALDTKPLSNSADYDCVDGIMTLDGSISGLEFDTDLTQQRQNLVELSTSLAWLLKRFGHGWAGPLIEIHCPKAKGGKGATWLQDSEAIANPYLGVTMLRSGTVVETLKPSVSVSDRGNPP